MNSTAEKHICCESKKQGHTATHIRTAAEIGLKGDLLCGKS